MEHISAVRVAEPLPVKVEKILGAAVPLLLASQPFEVAAAVTAVMTAVRTHAARPASEVAASAAAAAALDTPEAQLERARMLARQLQKAAEVQQEQVYALEQAQQPQLGGGGAAATAVGSMGGVKRGHDAAFGGEGEAHREAARMQERRANELAEKTLVQSDAIAAAIRGVAAAAVSSIDMISLPASSSSSSSSPSPPSPRLAGAVHGGDPHKFLHRSYVENDFYTIMEPDEALSVKDLHDGLRSFWQGQQANVDVLRKKAEKGTLRKDDFKGHNDLPLARIKRIMKSDEDVRMISAEAPVLFAKACEMFILEMTQR